MKKITALIALTMLLSCEKEIPIITAFDFNLETLYVSNVVVNTTRQTEFTITPEQVVSTNTHSFRYVLTQGSGSFFDESGVMIPQNEWRPLNSLIFTFDYLPTTAETHQLTIFVRDSSGAYEHSQELTYEVSNNGFTFTATATTTEVNVEIPIPVNFNLNQIGEGTVNYTMLFESTGDGILDYDGVIYTAGEPIPLQIGSSSGDYIGTSGGTHNITFTVNNDNVPPVIEEDNISVVINNFLFDFIGLADDNTIFSGATIDLNFDINETEGESPLYEMRYVFNQGNAILRDVLGNEVSPNVYYEIDDPINGFIWELEGTDIGTVDITFYIRNHIENEEMITMVIEVAQPSDFSINTFIHQEDIYQQGGPGELCQINYYSRATFTADYVAEGGQLTFVSLIRTDTGDVIDDVAHFLAQGESITYNDLEDNVEYQVHYTNMVTGEDIIKTFVSLVAPPNESLQDCFVSG